MSYKLMAAVGVGYKALIKEACSGTSFSCFSRPTFLPLTTLLWKILLVCFHIQGGRYYTYYTVIFSIFWYLLCIFILTFLKCRFLVKDRVHEGYKSVFQGFVFSTVATPYVSKLRYAANVKHSQLLKT